MHTDTILRFSGQWITGLGSLPKALLFQDLRTILTPTNGILPPANAGDSLVHDPAWQAMVSSILRRGYRPTGSLGRQPKRHKARSAEITNRAACASLLSLPPLTYQLSVLAIRSKSFQQASARWLVMAARLQLIPITTHE